jgi:hypothetical protein
MNAKDLLLIRSLKVSFVSSAALHMITGIRNEISRILFKRACPLITPDPRSKSKIIIVGNYLLFDRQ